MILFSIKLSEIHRDQLPVSDQLKTGAELKKAICDFLLSQYINHDKPVMASINDDMIVIEEMPDFDEAINLFSTGKLKEGVEICDFILSHDSNHQAALYNSGIALSDLGKFDAAIERLTKAYYLYKTANTATAIGVAYTRQKNIVKAEDWFNKALELDPSNVYALTPIFAKPRTVTLSLRNLVNKSLKNFLDSVIVLDLGSKI